MQPTTRFLQGPANDVHGRVFLPLAKEVGVIKASKQAYSCFPFVKLRTVNEGDPKTVQVGFSIVDSSYETRFNSFVTGATKFCTESRNCFGTAVNLVATNWMWNCLGSMTAQTLGTAVNAFSQRVGELRSELRREISPQELQDLRNEILEIQITLNSTLKTVFYIYRTYNLQPDIDQVEDLTSSNELEALRPQYFAIRYLTNVQLPSLLEIIDGKLNPSIPVELENSPEYTNPEVKLTRSKTDSSGCLCIPKSTIQDVMTNRTLVFKSVEAASTWFKVTLARCRDAQGITGPNCYSNLMRLAKIAKTVPQDFLTFAKKLDKTFGDDLVGYETLEEVCQRFSGILTANGRPLPLKKYNHFKGLFNDLCSMGVAREIYQDFFRALMNAQGTAPFGLQCEGALLNAIMNSVYFPMFDTEHQMSSQPSSAPENNEGDSRQHGN